jgi:enoyl-CoA hydratase/carnithine racemase
VPTVDPDATAVRYERLADRIALVTLNRPKARNAINAEVAQQLSDILAHTESDDEVRVVILTGSGTAAFCAGADLKEVDSGGMAALFRKGGFAGFVDAPRRKPWIAAVNGFALAGGCEIALACDMIVAADSASFGLPEVQRGLIAAAGGAYRLSRKIAPALAAELVLTGRMMSAVEAAECGLVNRVTETEQLVDEALCLARLIAANAPLAVAASLELLRGSPDLADGELGAKSRAMLQALSQTQDYSEGPRAFLEKRMPIWKGC